MLWKNLEKLLENNQISGMELGNSMGHLQSLSNHPYSELCYIDPFLKPILIFSSHVRPVLHIDNFFYNEGLPATNLKVILHSPIRHTRLILLDLITLKRKMSRRI